MPSPTPDPTSTAARSNSREDAPRRHPALALDSAEQLSRGGVSPRSVLARIEAVRTETTGSALNTIGYEGHSLESYLTVLLKSGVTILCDVRRNPISRKYGFSKNTLARGCEGVGIRYEHLPELGIASDKRQGLESQADYDALFAEYKRTWLPKHGAALEKIQGWMDAGDRVSLTCCEHQPNQCHRHCVAEALEGRASEGLTARHL